MPPGSMPRPCWQAEGAQTKFRERPRPITADSKTKMGLTAELCGVNGNYNLWHVQECLALCFMVTIEHETNESSSSDDSFRTTLWGEVLDAGKGGSERS